MRKLLLSYCLLLTTLVWGRAQETDLFAVESAFKYIYPDQKLSFKYTTVNGVQGFEG